MTEINKIKQNAHSRAVVVGTLGCIFGGAYVMSRFKLGTGAVVVSTLLTLGLMGKITVLKGFGAGALGALCMNYLCNRKAGQPQIIATRDVSGNGEASKTGWIAPIRRIFTGGSPAKKKAEPPKGSPIESRENKVAQKEKPASGKQKGKASSKRENRTRKFSAPKTGEQSAKPKAQQNSTNTGWLTKVRQVVSGATNPYVLGALGLAAVGYGVYSWWNQKGGSAEKQSNPKRKKARKRHRNVKGSVKGKSRRRAISKKQGQRRRVKKATVIGSSGQKKTGDVVASKSLISKKKSEGKMPELKNPEHLRLLFPGMFHLAMAQREMFQGFMEKAQPKAPVSHLGMIAMGVGIGGAALVAGLYLTRRYWPALAKSNISRIVN